MGQVGIPNRPTGKQKPAIADILANFDSITDFLNKISNPSNTGSLDPTNMVTAAIPDKLGLNSSVARRKRVTASPGLMGGPIAFPGTSILSGTIDAIGANPFIFVWIDGNGNIRTGSGTLKFSLWEDGVQLFYMFISTSSFSKSCYIAPLDSNNVTDPAPGSGNQFQFRTNMVPAMLKVSPGSHTYEVKVEVITATQINAGSWTMRLMAVDLT